MKKIFAVYLVLLLGLIAFVIVVAGAGWKYYMDAPSAAIILLAMFLISGASYGVSGAASAFKAPFMENAGSKALRHSRNFFNMLRRTLWLTAVIGFVIGNIAMLTIIDTVGGDAKGVALASLVLFYALIVDLALITPFLFGIEKKLIDLENE